MEFYSITLEVGLNKEVLMMTLQGHGYLLLQFIGLLFLVAPFIFFLFYLPGWAFFLLPSVILIILLFVRHVEIDRRRLRHAATLERSRAEEQKAQAEKLEAALRELQQKNAEIVATQQKLVSLDQFATLGQLMAGIAHEIKTPLNFVNNFSDLSTELIEELKEILNQYQQQIKENDFNSIMGLMSNLKENNQDILDNGKRADSIIKSIMDHARGTETQRVSTDINKLLDENIKIAYHGYRAIDPHFNIDINRQFDSNLPEVSVFPADLGRVLLNILNNACYATRLKQKQSDVNYHPSLTISTGLNNDNLLISIKDNGMGIKKDILDKMFLPFYTTKPSGAGHTGLGLSISREIIEDKHKGKIEVESQPDNYTQFLIILPVN